MMEKDDDESVDDKKLFFFFGRLSVFLFAHFVIENVDGLIFCDLSSQFFSS